MTQLTEFESRFWAKAALVSIDDRDATPAITRNLFELAGDAPGPVAVACRTVRYILERTHGSWISPEMTGNGRPHSLAEVREHVCGVVLAAFDKEIEDGSG